jgi:hypothetical protein
MSYGKKLNELDRQVDRFGIDDDFCRELCALAQKIAERYPIGNDQLKECTDRFQESEFMYLMGVCRIHLEKYTQVVTTNDDSSSSYAHVSV